MLKVGLTGGIGSGKSIVAGIFKVLGIPVFDADSEAKKIMENDPYLRQQLINEFGEETYLENRLNRPYLAAQVFNNVFKLDKLNAIVHPATINAADKWMKSQTTPYVIKEAALLFEAGSAVHLDYVIGVFAPEPIRVQRVMERDNVTREEVKARMNRQIQDKIKMKLCDFVLINNERQLLTPQVLALHDVLVEKLKG
ncbi:MAG TPA: dephospho-CoA kinase [Segetibacter sp.]|jgi:dephospho-CoA kinase